jgi:hypothetical protein
MKYKWPKVLCDGPCSVVHLQQVNSKLCSVKSKTTVSVEGKFLFLVDLSVERNQSEVVLLD